MENKILTKEMEYALYEKYGLKSNLFTLRITYLPNIINHECDVLMVSKSNYLTEIEIKVSLADLKKDLGKWHKHSNDKIKYQYFAIPEYLEKYAYLIPENFGVLLVKKQEINYKYENNVYYYKTHYRVREFKKAPVNPIFCKFKLSDNDLLNLYRLHSYRYWSLFKKNLKKENLYIERKE